MRLFIAINFNELKDYFIELQNKIDKSLAKLKEVSTFHLTLKFLGEVSNDKVSLIEGKLREIKFNPSSLTLNKIGVFPNENYINVIWIDIKPKDKVIELQKNIENSLNEFNFKKDFKFYPHITLARVKFVKDKEKFIKNLKDIKVEEKTIGVNNFRLIKSTLKAEGPVYEDIEIFSTAL